MPNGPQDPLGVARLERLGAETHAVFRPDRLRGVDSTRWSRRPRTVKVLLENLVRHFDPARDDPEPMVALANGERNGSSVEFAFHPERILLQDFTGVPVLVDLSMLRDAAAERGRDPSDIQPAVPVDLIVDHSVQVDSYGSDWSFGINLEREHERNHERYGFLRWAHRSYSGVRVVPPGNGICHQVNLEFLASVVQARTSHGVAVAFPDTLVGTDSHTTMVNGLSVLGWGVGGIEAEAAMLGEPLFLARPRVVGLELTGQLPEGATATDLVLTVTRRLRAEGVVDSFVEFFGRGVRGLSVADRATVSNMSPEFGATASLFPVDEATIAYLRLTGRTPELTARVEAYARSQGLWGSPDPGTTDYDRVVALDLSTIVPIVSGPRNPEEGVTLAELPSAFRRALDSYRKTHAPTAPPTPQYPSDDPLQPFQARGDPGGGTASGPQPSAPLRDGSVVIAAITSCTNTSNPTVIVAAGLVARKAVELGVRPPAHVKTSLAPGSKVVTRYLERAGLLPYLERLGFNLVGYGCTTCIGNSGPLPPEVARQVRERDLFVAAVLSGNRNFEARIHNQVRANYLASPPLVVAYALAGRVDLDLSREPVTRRPNGEPVTLHDLWPSNAEIRSTIERALDREMFETTYRTIEKGGAHWESLQPPDRPQYPWESASTYLAKPPFLKLEPPWLPRAGALARGARVLLALGDRISTDHISPAGAIPPESDAARFLRDHGVPTEELNTYGARRGNHEVMVRGTFANLRLRNALVAPKEGGYTVHLPSGEVGTVFQAAERYRTERTPLIVLAGKSYGQGSSRDWAAKGPRLLGVGAVIAESFERIHRSNLIQMGVLPLVFPKGEGWSTLGLTGQESLDLSLQKGTELTPGASVGIVAHRTDGSDMRVEATCELRSKTEIEYYRAGGVLPFVMSDRFPPK